MIGEEIILQTFQRPTFGFMYFSCPYIFKVYSLLAYLPVVLLGWLFCKNMSASWIMYVPKIRQGRNIGISTYVCTYLLGKISYTSPIFYVISSYVLAQRSFRFAKMIQIIISNRVFHVWCSKEYPIYMLTCVKRVRRSRPRLWSSLREFTGVIIHLLYLSNMHVR